MRCPKCSSSDTAVSRRGNSRWFLPLTPFCLRMRCLACNSLFFAPGLLFGGAGYMKRERSSHDLREALGDDFEPSFDDDLVEEGWDNEEEASAAAATDAPSPDAPSPNAPSPNAPSPNAPSPNAPSPDAAQPSSTTVDSDPAELCGLRQMLLDDRRELQDLKQSYESDVQELGGLREAILSQQEELRRREEIFDRDLQRLEQLQTEMERQLSRFVESVREFGAQREQLARLAESLEGEKSELLDLSVELRQGREEWTELRESLASERNQLQDLKHTLHENLEDLRRAAPSPQTPADDAERRAGDKIRFRCPHCSRRVKVSARFAGQRATCSSCNQELIIPGDDDRPEDA